MYIDSRQREELLQLMEKRAAAYVPEWRFDRENPDLGTALALIYGELFAQTLKRYNQVPEKNRIAFFSDIGSKLLPALPAEGFVSFGLAGQVSTGEEVAGGTPLLADVEDEEENTTTFETIDDILVTPAQLESIFTVCGGRDYIAQCYAQQEDAEPFYLFDPRGENLQIHSLQVAQEQVLDVSGGAIVKVELVPSHRKELPYEVVQILSDPKTVIWEYSNGEFWQAFDRQSQSGNCAVLEIGRDSAPITPMEPSTPQDEARRQIRLRLAEDVRMPAFALQQMRLTAENDNLLPNHVYSSSADQDVHEFFPFGEQLGLFAEGYFGCEEALVKAGAEITLTFNLDFVPIPVEYDATQSPINWKLVMKKSDFRPDEEFDISVQEVLWEYFNGNGWTRLFPDNRYAKLFAANKGALAQHCKLTFPCPADMAPALVGAGIGYYIRARALKISNLYKLKGYYIAPLIEGMRFAYKYIGEGVLPQWAKVENNCESCELEERFFRDAQSTIIPFVYPEEDRAALYLRFSAPPTGGPVKMLFLLAEGLEEEPGRLLWQYRSSKGWETLSMVDETQSFRQTGILTVMVNDAMLELTLWGESGYWMRGIDEEGRYFHPTASPQLPHITAVHDNTTRIRNIASRAPEQFFINPEEQNFTCQLNFSRVVRAEVWVNELAVLTPKQLEELQKQGMGVPVYDRAGNAKAFWVRWEEREDFDISLPDERHYTLDKNSGTICFSDGVHGKIPPSGRNETIEVRYVTGGGAQANLPVGAVNRGARSMGFVSQVGNPRPTVGGCDPETLEEALHRGGAALRHGDRAVTAGDFEELALEATRSIVRARCFSNRDDRGERAPGQVTLVVLLRDYLAGGDLFPAVRSRILEHLNARCGGNLAALEQLYVVAPKFLELSVKAELTVHEFNQVFGVRQAVRERLEAFLDPLTGNFNGRGWKIGQIPNETQLRNCLSGVEGMVYLKHISVTAFTEGRNGRMELTLDDLKGTIYALPRSGEHEILVTIE